MGNDKKNDKIIHRWQIQVLRLKGGLQILGNTNENLSMTVWKFTDKENKDIFGG